jgi:hypothetical protein
LSNSAGDVQFNTVRPSVTFNLGKMSSPAPSDPIPVDRSDGTRPPVIVDASDVMDANAIDNSDEFEDETEKDLTAIGRGKKRYRGRPTSSVWKLFTNDLNPAKLKSAVCKHCKTLINHHKKGESAQVHLNRCLVFCRLMNGLNIEDRPIWYERNKKSISRRNLGKTLALPSASTMDQSSIRNYL